MPAPRLSMRHVQEVLRLKWGCGLSERKIAHSCGISRPTVAEYVRRAQVAGLSWPLPEALDAAALERLLFPARRAGQLPTPPLPDWATVHQELKRKGVTLFLLWQEYKAAYPEGGQYSWFCQAYRAWAGKLDLVMRQPHRAGEKLFVDYAGQGNLKAAVQRAHRYEPDLNRTYADLAHHYGFAVLPARAARPRDKAKVEVGVQVVERWIIARLRHQTFFALAAVNTALTALRAELNTRPFKKLPGSRQQLFESLDRPALRPLPGQPYEYAEWIQSRVHID
jgi:transposase